MLDKSYVGTRWCEKDKRFSRIVEIVSVGTRVGRRTVSFNGAPGHPTRVTYGDTIKFLKRFAQDQSK